MMSLIHGILKKKHLGFPSWHSGLRILPYHSTDILVIAPGTAKKNKIKLIETESRLVAAGVEKGGGNENEDGPKEKFPAISECVLGM